MMKRTLLALVSVWTALLATAQTASLTGFAYADRPAAPTGEEWQSPEALALNKEQPRAWGFHFATEQAARGVMPERGAYWQSLNGTWKFHWCKTPAERPQKFYERSFNTANWDDIEVPGCWNVQGIQKVDKLTPETTNSSTRPLDLGRLTLQELNNSSTKTNNLSTRQLNNSSTITK